MKSTTGSKSKKMKKNHNPVLKTKDLPATQHMLDLMEKKLLKEMSSEFRKVDAQFANIDSKFANIDAKFANIDAKFANIDAKFANIDARFESLEAKFDSKFDKMTAEFHRLAILMEEQNSRNKFVLDGYALLHDKIERIEKKDLDNN